MKRRISWILALGWVMAWAVWFTGSAAAAPRFAECPAVGSDTGCQLLITVTKAGPSIGDDSTQSSYAGNTTATHETPPATDVLIGVRNASSQPLASLQLSGPNMFAFDGDGICNNASGPVPSGCATPSGSTACGADNGPCSFPPPAAEPAGYKELGAQPATPPWPNGDIQNGYEGPTSWFSGIGAAPNNSGTVNFSPAVPPGGSTYFSVEGVPTNLRQTTVLAAAQSAAAGRGATLYLPFGLPVRSTARVEGASGVPKGQITFGLFHRAACTGTAVSAGTIRLTGAAVRSRAVSLTKSGTYYWLASYSGDTVNAPSSTSCGSGRVVVPRSGTIGLPSSARCVSHLVARLGFGRHKAKAALVFANGKLAGRIGGKIAMRLHKRTKLSVIASSVTNGFGHNLTASADFRQQSRTYRPC